MNGLKKKKTSRKMEGDDNKFLVDSHKAIDNSCWSAHCKYSAVGVCGSECVSDMNNVP